MDNSNINASANDARFNRISLIFILVGCVTTICLVFLFIEMFKGASRSVPPAILSAEQLGATDTSVLVAWSSSGDADAFDVICKGTDGAERNRMQATQPFAAIHGLEPNKNYTVTIVPLDDAGTHTPFEFTCTTSAYCAVTQIQIGEVTNQSADLSWEYEGVDEGFTVIAYALDQKGVRHLTTEPIAISPGAERTCTVSNLLSEINYTVCVMPNTRYADACKSTFTTLNNSSRYNSINIIQFVPCTYNSTNTTQVHEVYSLACGNPYKAWLLFNGSAKAEDKVTFTVYLTDENHNLISECHNPDNSLNPENYGYFIYRSFLSEFTAPSEKGNYVIHAALDHVTVARRTITVN